ncbi:MAG: hypothetical protein RL169_264 [Armatimonadota bacterium]
MQYPNMNAYSLGGSSHRCGKAMLRITVYAVEQRHMAGLDKNRKTHQDWWVLLKRAMRIELTPPAWKAGALPLSYARKGWINTTILLKMRNLVMQDFARFR